MKTHRRYPAAPRLASACSLIALLLAAPALHADIYTWVPTVGGNWDTTTANWNDGVTNPTTWVNGSGNTATFNAFGAGATIALSSNITTGTLATNGGATVVFNNGAGTSIDATQITTAGTTGSAGSIDMFKVLTGNHDFTYHSTGVATTQGRLNLKASATYTGDTFLTGTAYLLSDNVSNALPTGTTLNMTANTTFRINKTNITQEIAGLAGAGTFQVSSAGNTVTITTKASSSTSYSGSLTGSTNLIISGSGTQALTGGSVSFTGSTTISGGTLSLGNTSGLSGTSSVAVSGGTLTSSVANVNLGLGGVSLSTGGTIDTRGSAIGSFTLAASQDFTSTGGTLKFDLDTTSSLDQIKGSGAGSSFSLTSTSLTLNLLSWSVGDYNNSYTLFSGFVDGGTVSGVSITGYDTTNWQASLSNAGVLSFSAAAVPEPSTYAVLAGASMLGFAALRRRRSAR